MKLTSKICKTVIFNISKNISGKNTSVLIPMKTKQLTERHKYAKSFVIGQPQWPILFQKYLRIEAQFLTGTLLKPLLDQKCLVLINVILSYLMFDIRTIGRSYYVKIFFSKCLFLSSFYWNERCQYFFTSLMSASFNKSPHL